MGHDSNAVHAPVTFGRVPDSYKHWKLQVDGAVATLTLGVDKDAPLREGYDLKLNSYDLGVDIELADAIRRLRFEHPAVRCVLVTSSVPKMFCAGSPPFDPITIFMQKINSMIITRSSACPQTV